MPVPPTIDRGVLRTYLADHLTGATAGLGRATRMAEVYADSEIGPELRRLADEIQEEHDHVESLIDRLDLRQPRVLRLAAKAAEVVARLKPGGRGPYPSPMTPMLEVELLRGAVNAKVGMWEALAHYADELGLDRADYERRTAAVDQQVATLQTLHTQLVPDALRPGQAGVL